MSVSHKLLYWQENYWIKFVQKLIIGPLALARHEGGR